MEFTLIQQAASLAQRRRLTSTVFAMVMATDSMLAVLMTAGLMLSDPVLAQQQSDPGQDLFPANLLLELTAEYISEEGRQIVVTPLFLPRETCDDLLFTEPAGQTRLAPVNWEIGRRQHLTTTGRTKPKRGRR